LVSLLNSVARGIGLGGVPNSFFEKQMIVPIGI